MNCRNEEDVFKLVHEADISFVHFWFTDMLGRFFSLLPGQGLNAGVYLS